MPSRPTPFTFLNIAATADGKLAPANRHFIPFSSQRDQAHMMELRATADAVMSGARTVDLSPVLLDPGAAKYRRLRLKNGLAEYNLRLIVSGSGTIDPDAIIFKKKFSPIIILTSGQASAAKLKKLRTLATEVKVFGKKELDFPAAFRWLKKKWKINRLLCEGGGELNAALFESNLVDEVHLTLCPVIFGGRTAPTLADGQGIKKLKSAAKLKLKSQKKIGQELFQIYQVERKAPALRVKKQKEQPT